MTERLLCSHLPAEQPGDDTLCNVKAKHWHKGKVVRTKPIVVDLNTFRKMKWSDGQCGRCFIKLCAREGTPMMRQR
jgi:hypothetical protein